MENEQQVMTVSEALAAGYTDYLYDEHDFQFLKPLEDLAGDDSEYVKILATKESKSPSIDETTIADLLANQIDGDWSSETGDDTSSAYDAVMAIDFKATAQFVNDALKSVKCYDLSGIVVVPDTVLNDQTESAGRGDE